MITYPTSTRLGRALLVFSGSGALGVARAQYQAGSSSEAMTTDAETDPYCRVGGSTRVDSGDGQKYHVGPSFRNLISNKVQPAGESPLTPTLSHEYAGEGADMLPLPLVGEGADMLPLPLVGEGAGMLPLPLAGEGWGEGGASSQGLRLKLLANQDRDRVKWQSHIDPRRFDSIPSVGVPEGFV